MEVKSRRKRAAPEQLYRHCLQGGDCIPDVQNKFEQKTWADILLKIFGSVLYFGNLGIGSGRGSGGSLGYKPLGSVNTQTTPITPSRPNVLIDVLGSSDIIPIDAAAPSLVPLSEGTIDVGLLAPDAGPGKGVEELELYTITDPTTDVGVGQTTPTVVTTEEGAAAVIDAQPIPERPVQVYYDPSHSAVFDMNVFPAIPTTSTDINVFVDSYSSNVIGGFDEIPLTRLDYEELEIEEPALQSTPIQKVEAALGRAKNLYSRYFKQVPVPSSRFLTQPSSLVQFEFENPAFEHDVTLEFERDLAQVTAAPDTEFADVIRLSRPQLSSVDGTVRVSRLGETGTISTRSGTVIGPRIHFYHDLSEIPAAEAIELQSLGEHSGLNTLVDDILASTVIDITNTADLAMREEDLLDVLGEDFRNTHLVFAEAEEESAIIPIITSDNLTKTFIPQLDNDIIVFHDVDYDTETIHNLPNNLPIVPAYIFDTFGDFFLHPGLLPKKRRRLGVI